MSVIIGSDYGAILKREECAFCKEFSLCTSFSLYGEQINVLWGCVPCFKVLIEIGVNLK